MLGAYAGAQASWRSSWRMAALHPVLLGGGGSAQAELRRGPGWRETTSGITSVLIPQEWWQ